MFDRRASDVIMMSPILNYLSDYLTNQETKEHPDLTFKLELRFIPEVLPIETTEQPMLPIDNYALTQEDSFEVIDMHGPFDSDMSEILARVFIPEWLNGDDMFLCPDNIYRPAKRTKRFSELPTMMAIEIPRVYHDFETGKREVDCTSIKVSTILDMTNDFYDHMFTSGCERKKYTSPQTPPPNLRLSEQMTPVKRDCEMCLPLLMVCNNCGSEAMMRCTVCQKTYYCTRSCQQADWTHHRVQCNELKSQSNGISIFGPE
jgi:hypothetical protein